MEVLVIDVGGSRVKFRSTAAADERRFESGPDLTADSLVEQVRDLSTDWRYDVVSLGYPGTVDSEGPRVEPGNLADGWIRFDFSAAFGTPVRVVNDAVLQALGAYDGGRMLFLGLGTGLGSALVTERVVVPDGIGQSAVWLGNPGRTTRPEGTRDARSRGMAEDRERDNPSPAPGIGRGLRRPGRWQCRSRERTSPEYATREQRRCVQGWRPPVGGVR